MTEIARPNPVVLCILDGWGYTPETKDNAIFEAKTPFFDKLFKENPYSLLETSGLAVGLPDGQMGNSEVGHMNIGSGRIVMQSLPLIDQSIKDGSLAKNDEINSLIEKLKETGGACHVLGLLSPGGVHSHQDHMAALVNILSERGIKVKIHAFTDGRDTPPESALEYLEKFEKDIKNNGEIVTVSGRYYAMDRDKRWDRVSLAYNAIVSAEGEKAKTAKDSIQNSYAKAKADEFIKPTVINGYSGIKDGDAIIMANFRSDRARQILSALTSPDFNDFNRTKTAKFSAKLGMVEYSEELNKNISIIFKPTRLTNILGEVIAQNNLKQLRIAETEKYAHVTFFFNGGEEKELKGEDRILIPSPNVATYDLKPEMSAYEVTEKLVEVIDAKKYDLIVVNYANTDMVGHTGIKEAAIKAVEALDICLQKLNKSLENAGGCMFITADHGNAEQMTDDSTGQPHTAHTTNPVPFIAVGKCAKNLKLKNGRLCDIAPTLLKVMNIEKPTQMTGESLI